ncbi:Acidic fibroblast growth factor intracellular binding protein [Fasciola hepatica]|uniref:Acidic fibroblast growth factor intracellular binding protein n=1 Tax=Fasciola hepatica TaxID=6192 RepID=A0A4E0RJE2_FASHE|nr:Acidic fibroblast growth factor intracellular binding protein [Fasciola hepatica]
MLQWLVLIILESYLTQGNQQAEEPQMNYIYLQMPHNMPSKDQYTQRTGFPRGSIGSLSLPVIQTPKSQNEALKPINVYHFQQNVPQTGDQELPIIKASDITLFYFWFLFEKRDTYITYIKANSSLDKIIAPFVSKMPAARLQFITFYCMLRQNPKVTVLEDGKIQVTTEPFPDFYRFCPSVCADREGPGLSSQERRQLNRFTKPCSYPKKYLPFISRKCTVAGKGPFHVHRESFTCSCQGNTEWSEQLKTCHYRLSTADREKVASTETSPGAATLKATVDCFRDGTLYVGGVSFDADNGGEEVIRSTHQALRCVCKPQYYGTRCDKLKDPCIMSVGNAIPGHVACGVDKGNRCIPNLEESRYSCQCSPNYQKITSLKDLPTGRLLDNCLRQRDPCAVQSCMHGTCVLSDFGSTMELLGKQSREPFSWIGRVPQIVARCLCNAGWSGEKCSYPLVLNGWSPWSPWTSCEPSCQSSLREMPPQAQKELVEAAQSTPRWGVRQRTRYRDCMGYASDCRQELKERFVDGGGKTEDGQSWRQYERRACRPRPCDRLLYLAMGKRAVKRSKIMKQVRETLKQAYTVHLWTVLAFTFVFAIFGFVAAFATKIHSEKSFEHMSFPGSREGSLSNRR